MIFGCPAPILPVFQAAPRDGLVGLREALRIMFLIIFVLFVKKMLNCKDDYCPVTTDVSKRIVRLPLFYNMTKKQHSKVLNDIKAFHC